MNEQVELFDGMTARRSRPSKEYGAFTDKFKTKLTTDDCYTPVHVYEAVRDWCVGKYGLGGREIVRPFYPGGDFEKFDYPDGCVVIDNPPFSIYGKILDFYTNVRQVDFFLFGPTLTLFKRYDACYIVCNETVEYANGAKVNTSFVTSLDRENRIVCDRSLKDAVRAANAAGKPKPAELSVIEYPPSLVTSAILGKTSRVDFAVRKSDAAWVSEIGRNRIFGSGFVLSDRATADRVAADRVAADRAAADRAAADRRKRLVRELDADCLEKIARMNENGKKGGEK